ncbi:germination lipoprotein GerS-related protein [Clostridium thermobutyricum]|uniref:germination lipoprotein GerS-related protein n=1 Tax=Clostridium thermobutyricum TaxID=29372 RepID=UPI003F526DF0
MSLLEKFKKNDNKNLKKKLKIGSIIILPIFILGLIVFFRNEVSPTNEQIIDSIKNMEQYESIVEFTITNTRGSYVEKAKLHYSKNHDPIMEFGDRLVKTYKKDSIIMKYKDGKEYNLEKDTDSFYVLAIINNLLNNPVTKIENESLEWGDLEYIKVSIDIISNNQHLDKAVFYVNKKEKVPMLIKIFDVNGKERVKIEYREFNKKDKC